LLSLRGVANELDPLSPPKSLRGLLARQPWVPVEASTGIPKLPVSCKAVFKACTDGHKAAVARLENLLGNLQSTAQSMGPPIRHLKPGLAQRSLTV
jgi:hypothetical protein